MAIGVFGLQVAYRLKRLEVMSTDDTHGWFGGGSSPLTSRIDRIDFSNDTVTTNIRGLLSAAKYQTAATGNSNYGWFGGGKAPAGVSYSTVDRVDFSNDSAAVLQRGSLFERRINHAATGNSNYGWFGGGTSVGNIISRVERIDFSNDAATASPRGPLSSARGYLAATGNSNYGWFGGGFPQSSRVDRIDFSNDSTAAALRGQLSNERYLVSATGNSNYGWFSIGQASLPSPSIVDRVDFSNDSAIASVRGPLTINRSAIGATANSNYGWFGGGTGTVSRVDRVDFSNDNVIASIRGPLSAARSYTSATSGQAKGPAIKLAKILSYGWFGGGATATVDRIDFSNDNATASLRGPLSVARQYLSATGNSNYGWFISGGYVPILTTVNRINFSNDLQTTLVRNIFSRRTQAAATGNANYGWFSQGGPGTTGSLSSERLDYSNDSTPLVLRSYSTVYRQGHAATGNANYGWFGGGNRWFPAPTSMQSSVVRIDYSNDSNLLADRSSLSLARYFFAATGNSNYGWFAGGAQTTTTPSTQTNIVDRIDFSNDLATISPRSLLSVPRGRMAAVGNSNYGWFGGGVSPASSTIVASVDRIDFSNDLATASPRGPLSAARSYLAATPNTPT
jgi:hypothetical protein